MTGASHSPAGRPGSWSALQNKSLLPQTGLLFLAPVTGEFHGWQGLVRSVLFFYATVHCEIRPRALVPIGQMWSEDLLSGLNRSYPKPMATSSWRTFIFLMCKPRIILMRFPDGDETPASPRGRKRSKGPEGLCFKHRQ